MLPCTTVQNAHTVHVTLTPTPNPRRCKTPDLCPYVQEAWDNHFEAFGSQNLDKIMLDYDETSVLRCFCHSDGADDTFKGVEEIRGFFDGLFKMLSDLRSVSQWYRRGVFRERTANDFCSYFLCLTPTVSCSCSVRRSEHNRKLPRSPAFRLPPLSTAN